MKSNAVIKITGAFILILIVSFGILNGLSELGADAQTADSKSPYYGASCNLKIVSFEDEDGVVYENTLEENETPEDWQKDNGISTSITNLAKSVIFWIQVSSEVTDRTISTSPGSSGNPYNITIPDDYVRRQKYSLDIEVEDGDDWNITFSVTNDVRLSDDDISLYLTDDGFKRANEMDRLSFWLAPGEYANIKVEVKGLSSLSPGDEVTITVVPSEDTPGCHTPTHMTVKVESDDDFSVIHILGIIAAFIGLIFAYILYLNISKSDEGNDKVKEISKSINEGAMAFLNKEYRILVIFSFVVVVVLLVAAYIAESMTYWTPVTFVVGALFSAIAGNIGMRIATSSNGRTATAVEKDLKKGLQIAFSSGAVMGLSVVSLGLLGVSGFYFIFKDPNILFGFGFGASSIALFARVGGGIYTKSADVGADLVGKVEKGIPEDDPRNPAVIADNVGDNVGDVAGMGADLFESYVDSIIAAMILGVVGVGTLNASKDLGGFMGKAVLLPLIIAGLGIISAIIGIFVINNSKEVKSLHGLLNKGLLTAALFQGITSLAVVVFWLGMDYFEIWGAMVAGLVSGLVIGYITEYYTSDEFKPTKGIAESSKSGAAPNIIEGLSVGMISTIVPVVMVCITLIFSFWMAGLYGIAISAVGMLSTLGITLATDSYGPVADNAAGIAEMAGMGKKVRERAEKLDAVGNTTAAIGKGFAIGSAALTALALFSTYTQTTQLTFGSLSLMDPYVMVGVFIGVLLVFVFSALTMAAVGKAAMEMVEEVRRQFKEIKGLMQGKQKPEYKKCVMIATGGALRQMILPSVLAVATPVVVGLVLGPEALGGLLGGALVAGFLMAIMMANSGGAWDNAKKYIEAGNLGGKGSEAHKAAVVGDTVGDPFKDTSGPSLNILIKLMSIVSLVFAPLFLILH